MCLLFENKSPENADNHTPSNASFFSFFEVAAVANQVKCHYQDSQFESCFDILPPEGQSAAL